ncbi:MAG: hypothetical protein ACYTEQ_16520 [Planctomycetota bacterium]|jgi:hypothetical protein
MFRKPLLLAALLLILSPCKVQAAVIDSNWLGCNDGLWANAGNWSPAIVPDNGAGNTFVVAIDTSGCPNEVQVGLQQDRTIDQLDCDGQLWLDAWTPGSLQLTIYNGLTNYGQLDIGDIDIRGDVTNTAGATLGLHDKQFIPDGSVYNKAGARIDISGDIHVEKGNIDNEGQIMVVPVSRLTTEHTLHNRGQINIWGGDCGADEIIDNDSAGTITGYGTLHGGTDLFSNEGKIYALGGSLAVGAFGPIINSGLLANKPSASLHVVYVTGGVESMNNQGTVEVNAGGGVTFDSSLVNTANVNLLGGTLAATTITQSAEANFAGFGSITADVVINTSADIKLTGPTNIVGDVTIGSNATLEISDGTTLITGHTTCNNGIIHMKGGRIIPQGGLTNNGCSIIWEPGTYTNVADFNLDGLVNFIDFAYLADTWLWLSAWR